jgi:hypothetical protein
MTVDDKERVEAEIKAEEVRLRRIFARIDKKRKAVTDGLIKRAAFMRVALNELEIDITVHGLTEWFSQGDQEPYKRRRPEAEIYNSMNTSYQKIIKQLTDLLPKDDDAAKKKGDGFDEFVSDRDD